jgi:hypothetical protein
LTTPLDTSAQSSPNQAGTSAKAAVKGPARIYLPNRAEEDWSFLADSKYRSDFYDPLKYIALGKEAWYLSLGGEVRFRPEGFRVRATDTTEGFRDNYLFQRYLFHVDFHFGHRFRFFGELQSGLINGKLRSPRPTDADTLEMHQAFLEFKSPLEGDRKLLLRVGRQELAIGSSRLISAAQGLNVKRSFDGAAALLDSGKWRWELGAAKLVRITPGAFNNSPDPEQSFWGMGASRRATPFKTSSLSAYYLGLERQRSFYQQGIGSEQRHTLGGKFAGTGLGFDYNLDLILQWGSFRTTEDVRGWALATELGYRFVKNRFRPRLGLRFNSASGDKDAADNRLESFNPMFPGTSYSGAVGLLGPTNLTDITPSIQVILLRNLILSFESPAYFRTSTADGVYGIDLLLLLRAYPGGASYVGSNPGFAVVWNTTRHFSVSGAITRFLSGPFLQPTPFQHGFGFYSASFTYRF